MCLEIAVQYYHSYIVIGRATYVFINNIYTCYIYLFVPTYIMFCFWRIAFTPLHRNAPLSLLNCPDLFVCVYILCGMQQQP